MHLRMTGNLLLRNAEAPAGAAADLMHADRLGPRAPLRGRAAAALPAGAARARRRLGAAVHRRAALRPRGRASRSPTSTPTSPSRLGIEPLSGELTPEALLRARRGADGAAQVVPAHPGPDRRASATSTPTRRFTAPSSTRSRRPGSMRAEHARALAEAIVETLEVALDNGGSSIDDYRDARGERGSMQDEFLVHTREGEECPRCGDGDPADRRRRALDLLLPGLPDAAAQAPAEPRPRPAVSEALAAPGGLRDRPLDRRRGGDGLHGDPGARGSARRAWTCAGGGPGTRETDVIAPLAGTADVTAVLLDRRQRVRPGGRRRRDALARGAGAGLLDAGGAGADRPGRGRSTTSPRATRRRVRAPTTATPPVRPRRPASPSAVGVGAGTGAAVGKIPAASQAVRTGVGYAAARSGRGRDGGGAGGRERVRGRDRRGRQRARRARGWTTGRPGARRS